MPDSNRTESRIREAVERLAKRLEDDAAHIRAEVGITSSSQAAEGRAEARETFAILDAENHTLAEQLIRLTQRLDRFDDGWRKAADDCDAAEDRVDDLTHALTQARQEIDNARRERDQAADLARQERIKFTAVAQDRDQLHAKLADTSRRLATARADLADIENKPIVQCPPHEKDRLEHLVVVHRSERDEARYERDAARDGWHKAIAEIDNARRERDQQHQAFTAARQEIDDLKTTMAEIDAQADRYGKRLDEVETERARLAGVAERHGNQRDRLQADLYDTRRELHQAHEEAKTLRAQVVDLNRATNEPAEALTAARDALDQVRNQRETALNHVRTLSAEVDKLETKLEKAVVSLGIEREMRHDAVRQIDQYRAEAANARNAVKSTEIIHDGIQLGIAINLKNSDQPAFVICAECNYGLAIPTQFTLATLHQRLKDHAQSGAHNG